MVEDKRQAGIEITEEMIAAAVEVLLRESAYDADRADCTASALVKKMITAVEEYREACRESHLSPLLPQ